MTEEKKLINRVENSKTISERLMFLTVLRCKYSKKYYYCDSSKTLKKNE